MRLVALLSSGIDSPVAAYMMAAQGAEVILLHMDNRPFTDDRSIEKVKLLQKRLSEEVGRELPLHIAPHGRNQGVMKASCQRQYQCVLCKRLMIRVATGLAKRLGAEAIVMGDSLGQVASQTLRNIGSEYHGLDFPVLRPLIGLDKLEIEAIAKRIGTYEISIMPEPPCGVVPIKPATMARIEVVEKEERKADLGSLVEFALEGVMEVRDL